MSSVSIASEITPITHRRMRNITSAHTLTTFADVLRQNAGVNIQAAIPNQEIAAVGTSHKKDIAPQQEKVTKTQDDKVKKIENDILENLKLWINPEDPQPSLARVTVEAASTKEVQENPLNLFELAKIRRDVKHQIDAWLSGRPVAERQKTLARYRSTLEQDAVEAHKRISILEDILQNETIIDSYEGESLAITLETAKSFIENDIRPNTSARQTQSREAYDAKARRILLQEQAPENGEDRTKRAKRAITILHALTKDNLANLVPQIELDILETASQVNHLRIVELLSQNNIDLASIKEYIATALPYLEQPEFADKKKLVLAIDTYLFPTLRKILPFIVKTFPHDHAFMLSQVLEKHRATCAGKTTTLNFIFESLGFQTQTADVTIDNTNTLVNHVCTHINLPHETILEIDTNYKPTHPIQNQFACLVNILQHAPHIEHLPLDRYPNEAELEKVTSGQYIIRNNTLIPYPLIWGSQPHRVSVERSEVMNFFNYANDLDDLNTASTSQERIANMRMRVALYEHVIRGNLHCPNAKNNLSMILKNQVYLESLPDDEARKQSMVRSLNLLREAQRESPRDSTITNNLNTTSNSSLLEKYGIPISTPQVPSPSV